MNKLKTNTRTVITILLTLVGLALASPVNAGTFTSSATAPTVHTGDIANLIAGTGSDKWFNDGGGKIATAAKGLTFTTGGTTGGSPFRFKAITYKCATGNMKGASPTAVTTYTVRVGTVSGTTFTGIASETFSQNFNSVTGGYMTWTFASPLMLSANTTYAVDVMMQAAGDYHTGIPYLDITGNVYAGGQLYNSGTNGVPSATVAFTSTQDRVFHLYLDSDTIPPTLASSSIVDDKSGGPVQTNSLVTYTLTFSKDMDASTVVAGDFSNAGTAAYTIGTVTKTAPGVFAVPVMPTGAGTLQLQVNAGAVLKDVAGNALVTTAAILDDTTITVLAIDTTPPTLVSIVDDKAGGPVAPNTLVTYTVTFSEAMAAGTVATDFGNAGTSAITIGTVNHISPAVFTVQATPTSVGTLQLQINAGAVLTDLAGNPLVTTPALLDDTTITVDGTPPTLIGADIVDNKGGGPVEVPTPMIYTVTFSKDMDGSTVTALAFSNAGTAAITIGAIAETTPTSGIFTVHVTPTTSGTLKLQINAGAVLKDYLGNILDTTSAIPDDTTITVNPDTTPPAPSPMTWASTPVATGTSSIAMTATTATDLSGVEYSFECTAGGGHPSGWQNSTTYTDSGLTPGTTYSYRVQARDKSPAQNATGFSSTATASTAQLATFTSSPTAPTVGATDIAYLGAPNGSPDKWWNDGPAGQAKGQTFTTGSSEVRLKALTYKIIAGQRMTLPTTYTVRVGTLTGTTFNQIALAIATQTVNTGLGDYITWTFGTPIQLAPNTLYAIDVALNTSADWHLGIPYLEINNTNPYAGGQSYLSGDYGVGGSTIASSSGQDRVFYLNLALVAPTLTSIVDDKSGGPVAQNTLVTYTVTFSKGMDASTVDASVFGNAGSAVVSIGTITETSPTSGIFTVPVTPTGTGTLQLQINAGAVLKDVAGNPLNTTTALLDDTTLTVTSAYSGWVGGASQTGFTQDSNGDGVANGIAWLLGATGPSVASNSLLPQLTSSPAGDLIMTFECLKQAYRGTATLIVEYSNDLGQSDPWIKTTAAAVPEAAGTVGGVGFQIGPSTLGDHYNHVVATIPASVASAGKIFARLSATE